MAAAVLAVACGAGTLLPPPGNTLAVGTWGGNNAAAIVSDSGMHVHVGCTYGDVAGLVPLVGDSFSVSGSYMVRAYPVAVGPTLPAVFAGRLKGAQLTLTVTVSDTVQHQTAVEGPVTLVWARQPQMGVCPICRTPKWGGVRTALP